MVWHGVVLCGVWCGIVWCRRCVMYGVVLVWCMVWCGVLWCMVWCGVVWCIVWCKHFVMYGVV